MKVILDPLQLMENIHCSSRLWNIAASVGREPEVQKPSVQPSRATVRIGEESLVRWWHAVCTLFPHAVYVINSREGCDILDVRTFVINKM